MSKGEGWGRVIHTATAKLASRPAAHHEWSGGGESPSIFLAIKGEELSFAAGSIEVGVAGQNRHLLGLIGRLLSAPSDPTPFLRDVEMRPVAEAIHRIDMTTTNWRTNSGK